MVVFVFVQMHYKQELIYCTHGMAGLPGCLLGLEVAKYDSTRVLPA